MLAVKKLKEGKKNIKLVEVDTPEILPDEVLMKVWAVGVCGSDLLIEDDKHFYKAPVIIGHEFSGVAWKVGSDVKKIKEGDHIVGDIETTSGWLGVTRDGAYAPFMSIPEDICYKVPKDFNLDHAVLTELIVATIHSMQERSNVKSRRFCSYCRPGTNGTYWSTVCQIKRSFKNRIDRIKKRQEKIGSREKDRCRLYIIFR